MGGGMREGVRSTTRPLIASMGGFVCLASATACSWLIDTTGLLQTAKDDAGAVDASSSGGDGGPSDAAASSDGSLGTDAPVGDGSRDGSSDGGGTCPGALPGPALVRVDSPSGAFCIDSTEVTRAAYGVFVNAGVSPSMQPSMCATNTSFTPTNAWPATGADLQKPVVGVDWCDARAYCAWAGKRPCGRIGGGGTLTLAEAANATTSEWYIACSKAGAFAYPYGPSYIANKCSEQAIVATGSLSGCEGGYPGIFDMSGNAHEWIDACDGTTSGTDKCTVSGSGYIHPPNEMQCSFFFNGPRTASSFAPVDGSETGFRCCL